MQASLETACVTHCHADSGLGAGAGCLGRGFEDAFTLWEGRPLNHPGWLLMAHPFPLFPPPKVELEVNLLLIFLADD